MKFPKELDNPRKGLINTQNIDDNDSFKWSLVRYLNPADHHPTRITKADKDFAKKFDFKDIITKLKKRIPSALVFLVMEIKKNMQSMHQKKC